MAELRRLLIRPERLQDSGSGIQLEPKESHYLRRVLRLRPGDALAVVDGQGLAEEPPRVLIPLRGHSEGTARC